MWVRKAFYWVQLVAIAVVPVWIIVATSIAPTGLGAQDILVFLAWPALALAQVAVLGITRARKAVRQQHILSWVDVAALSTWYAVAIAYGGFVAAASRLGAGLTGGLLIVVTIAVIALAVWQLVTAARAHVRTVMASLDYTAVPAGEYRASANTGPSSPGSGDGDVYRITPPQR